MAKAILSVGRATDPQAAKRWVIRRARELDAVDMLPKAWGISK